MIAVLASRWDTGARTVHDVLVGRLGAESVDWVLPADLVQAGWSHQVAGSGATHTRIRLPDGRRLTPDAVLHRLVGVPIGRSAAKAKDRDYIAGEFTALIASWLLSLGPRVLGSMSAYATSLGPSSLAALAAAEEYDLPVARRGMLTRGGLIRPSLVGERHIPRLEWPGASGAPVPVDVVSDLPVTTRLLVAAGRAHGPLAHRYGAAAERLSAALDSNLLELSFADGPALIAVSVMPPLDTGPHVEAVADALIDLATTKAENA